MQLNIVKALLAPHSPADKSEADSLLRIHDLIAGPGNSFSRDHFIPGHLTASGVVLDEKRERTLLIFHAKLKRWLQPGGHFEPGENDPSIAAAREVLEETAIVTRWPSEAPLLLDVDVHEIPARKNDPAHFHFDLRMLLIATVGEVKASEVAEARWVYPSEFGALDLDPGLQRALRKVSLL